MLVYGEFQGMRIPFEMVGDVKVINICDLLDAICPGESFGDGWTQSVRSWCEANQASYYAAEKEKFLLYSAMSLAKQEGHTVVVAEDLSLTGCAYSKVKRMSIVLYPLTRVPAKLERLAGVPAGTLARLVQVEGRHRGDDAGFFAELEADPALMKMNRFRSIGWGRIRKYVSPNGSTTDPGEVAAILEAQGLPRMPMEAIEGLAWG